jgi:hypothetical protein
MISSVSALMFLPTKVSDASPGKFIKYRFNIQKGQIDWCQMHCAFDLTR